MERYRKSILAAIVAGLIAIQGLLPLTDTEHSWIAVVLAVLGALGVYQVPNEPMSTAASSTRR